jgi:hypothetical protein
MKRHFLAPRTDPIRQSIIERNGPGRSLCAPVGFVLAAMLAAGILAAQVITIDTSGKGGVAGNGPVEHQYQQIVPTHVDLPKQELDARTRLALIRALESEQGFAMRPFPRGHKGLTLAANGKLEPAGETYLNMVVDQGLSAKPGQRVTITNLKVDKSRIIFDLDGGPDAKHRFLRHVQIGVGPMDDPDADPSMLDQSGDPAGARLTLAFADYVPEVTPEQVKALLSPLISFDVKTPIQAFTDTLPSPLKEAILNHKVWVGMSTDMVLFAKGRPRVKSREMEGQMPVEIWIYGTPPDDTTFVRINGNRVIRVEIAKVGQPMEVYDKDVVTPILMASGSPQMASESNTRVVHEGDVEIDPDKQAPAAAPSLRNPGEKLPSDTQSTGVMRPVQFPKPHPDDTPGANPDEQSSSPPANGQPAQTSPNNGGSAPASPPGNAQQSATGSQQQSAPANGQQPSSGSQQSSPGNAQSPPASSSHYATTSRAAPPASSSTAQSN